MRRGSSSMGICVEWAMWVAAFAITTMVWWEQLDVVAGDGSVLSTTYQNETMALLALKQSLQVDDSAWPKGSAPCSTWLGVSCVNGHVVELALSGTNHTSNAGHHPISLLDPVLSLPSLKSLVITDFIAPSTIPDWFGNLSLLESLGLSNSSLNGTIPASFGRLLSLQSLSLSHNALTGNIPAELGRLGNLIFLDLSYNFLNGALPTSLVNLAKLEALDLSSNFLYGPIPTNLAALSSLRRLSLSRNFLSESIPSEIGSLQNLSAVDLSRNNISGPIPPALGNLANLASLSLADNSLSGAMPAELTLCLGLRMLSLSNNLLSGDLPLSLGSLVNLVNVNFSWNGLSGSMPPGWDGMQMLQSVDLSHNMFYGALPADLSSLPKLAVLNVSDNFFNDSLPSVLPNVTITKKNCFQNTPKQHLTHSCDKFYSSKGVGPAASPPNSGTPAEGGLPSSPNRAPLERRRKDTDYKHLVPLFAGVGGGLGLIFLVGLLALCVHKFERRDSAQARAANADAGFGTGGAGIIVSRLGEAFSYTQLQQSTKKFHSSNLISSGHSGDLYKGLLERGTSVVVKRVETAKFRKDSYVPELEVYGKVTHARIVSLLGYCLEREDEKLLVYKFMPNGDLASALHTKGSPGPGDVLRSLDWITRLKVAIGAAEALCYLHHDCVPALVHRDVKASSILLDDKFEVRLGSLSEVRCQDGDSHPGLIRRLLGLSQSSDQGLRDAGQAVASSTLDVYNYGKVLLELVSGKLGISGTSDPRTDAWLEWAVPLIDPHDKESLPKLVDPSLIVDEDLLEEVWAVAIIAKACLNPKAQKRPSMRHVLKALENPHKVVRQDFQFGDTLAVRTSSHSSWNEALFGSWRHSSVIPGSLREEYSKAGCRGEYSQSHARRGSSDIVPEPISEYDFPRSR